ncbi:TPA: bifunctional acetaldehyde-CoA/alcohol dehydrogenase [Bacillus thuringiensis]|jgi:acetaldehyde dehydrogenase / alcohol dehydrogenase|uniref:Aldehyde-alcohol dehydrogenase n=3 Tax=Bacillus cereus group TaxID=86661 RepID=A0A9X6KRH1_BACTU|nr:MULTISPECIES: bifunctional acetaldehyde-CoA/alcohol dehydrogenase [Bacillus]NIE90690.1 bifunctional acetaldehyde-CoA/alcohol dehydrogenase [Bacillus sp. Ab-1751]AGE80257.1 Alcohol dehydrogenase, iron-containing [Bacillus thuringiensis serovar kurstaki str. HD73]AHZ53226.1 bifunctional acetaldehyde-CoA/alcohol dehydrogenase [Bacillus thuringiensis serovar kurstaki str. YBT-1520]AIE35653.1 bifunctional acetaldehyde-CoA/alcohol dehydrogenase [Bacillus thuringiensis serovar kurstaki str. HD-1]A
MVVKEKVVNEMQEVKKMIDTLVNNGQQALQALESFTQEEIDNIVHEMALAGVDQHMPLAKLAVEETGRGVYEDKCIKNIFATEYIWHSIKQDKTVGIIHEDPHEEIIEIAEPVGVVAGVTPVTNPTSTTMFKALIAIKTRNPIIFAFHPSAQKCSVAAAKTVYDAAMKAGAPKHCIQWIERPSVEATKQLMNHDGVALVLATGGAGMVKSAYSTGKPALGVGPGNVPCYIEKSAHVKRAVNDLILSKTFDNGMICASEQAIIVDKEIYDDVKTEMIENSCYFVTEEERKKLEKLVINENTCAVNSDIVGKSAQYIADLVGITVPGHTKMLVAEIQGIGAAYPLSREKLSPVLACVKANSLEEGFTYCEEMLNLGGLGHSAVIHSTNKDVQKQFGLRMKACRLIVNAPSSQGGIGDIYNGFIPSLTLGCGSYGKNSVSQNVTATHLLNIKRLANRKKNMQWFKLPPKIYFEKHATAYLANMPNISRAFIVTDSGMVEHGYVDTVAHYLNKNANDVKVEVFFEVEPDPSDETVFKGAEMMKSFKPDVIIALGGGSAMDAAKGMWLFYEHPETTFYGIKQKFLDIRKRTCKYPELGNKAQFVAIPTTSGTGSEVTPFAVITDKKNNIKYPLADYELTPDVAIVDPQFVMTVPPHVTADTGMDVLTHAIEAYVSVMANDYTDGLALKAIDLVFKYLPRAYKDGNDEEAREKMHNASAIAGMAFANAFLGINHSLAHKIGPEFHIPHGRANAILMPHVVRYNAIKPRKHALFPKYEHFVADERYAHIARMLGLPASSAAEGVESLVRAIIELGKSLNINMSIAGQGVDKEQFEEVVGVLAERAFEDQCTTANPKLPLISELKEIYMEAYKGE